MAQRSGADDELADRLGGISLEGLSGGDGKPSIGPAGLIHKDSDAIKLFVGQIPKHMEEEDLRPTFNEFGEIFDLAVIRDKVSGLHRGCAFLTYCARSSADAAIAALHGQRRLDRGQNPLQVRPAEGQAEQENKLFVGMAPKSANEDEIRAVFAPYGTLREIHVIRNQDGTNKGCAFVKYTTRQSALDAIDALHEQYTMQGGPRPLVVKFADNKRGAQAAAGRLGGMIGSPGRHGAGPHPEAGGWMHPGAGGQGAGYSYAMPAPPISPHVMPGMPYGMPYGGGQAPGAPAQGSYVYYPYGAPGYPPQPGGPGQYHSGPPSPSRGGGGYGGGGHPRSPSGSDRHRARGMHESEAGGGAGASRPAEGPPGANLFIYHLPQDLSDADLATAFAPFGHVLSAKVYIDRASGESKGFGFVSYSQPSHAEAAIAQMNGFQIGSKRLKVQHKRRGQSTDDPDDRDEGGGGAGYGDQGQGDYYPHPDYMGHQDGRFV
eukprot:g5526.t1